LFLGSLDVVLPRPEGLLFTRDAKALSHIPMPMPRNRYKDTSVLVKDVAAKVRQLIDDHVISLGVDPKIPPIALTDVDFDTHLSRQPNDRAKALEMEHAIRSHIRKHLDEDPVLSRKRSERLNEILKTLADQYDDLITALHKIVNDLHTGSAGMDAVPPDRFWKPFKRPAQDALGACIFRALYASRLVSPAEASALKDRLLELARANHDRLLTA
jgi:type I restriction enzyme R subunit